MSSKIQCKDVVKRQNKIILELKKENRILKNRLKIEKRLSNNLAKYKSKKKWQSLKYLK